MTPTCLLPTCHCLLPTCHCRPSTVYRPPSPVYTLLTSLATYYPLLTTQVRRLEEYKTSSEAAPLVIQASSSRRRRLLHFAADFLELHHRTEHKKTVVVARSRADRVAVVPPALCVDVDLEQGT